MYMPYYAVETFAVKNKKQQIHLERSKQIIERIGTGGTVVSLTGPLLDMHWVYFRDILGPYSKFIAVEWNKDLAKELRIRVPKITKDSRLEVVESDVWDVLLNPELFSYAGPLQVIDLDFCCTPTALLKSGFYEKLTELAKSPHLRARGIALIISLCTRNEQSNELLQSRGLPADIEDIFLKAGWKSRGQEILPYKEGAPMWQYFGCFKKIYTRSMIA